MAWEHHFRDIDPRVEPVEFVPDGDGVIVGIHQVVRDLNGNVLTDSHIADAYTFRADLVLSMAVHPNAGAAERESSL